MERGAEERKRIRGSVGSKKGKAGDGEGNEQIRIRMIQHPQRNHIHRRGNDHDPSVEVVQPPVFCQSLGDESCPNKVQKEEVKPEVDNEEEAFLDVFIGKVESPLGWGGPVQRPGRPDVPYGDVDASDDAEEGPAEEAGPASGCHDEGDAVDDDLGEELGLDGPEDD
jgi:hypothetical protein